MSSNPHDLLFKEVFGKPEHARGALRAVVPAVVAEAIDWPTLARCAGSFVDPALSERHTDLLFSVTWRGGGDALVYLLFEHQSTPDRRMAFRMLRYLVRVWDGWLADRPRAQRLPVIVPVVLYHGARHWSVPVRLDALFDLPEHVRAALAPHLVQFSYLIDDLSAVPDGELRARAMTALGRLVAVCFKFARTRPDLLDILAGWADVVREVAGAPNGLEALELVMRYILEVSDHVDLDELKALVERIAPDAKDTIMTAGQRLIQQGIEQGIQQGIEQGIERGVQKGERRMLLRQLRRRFGSQVTADIEQRVATATAEQIDAWADRVLTATTLAELWVTA
jgi:predicted transposase/invertase (TIGR01784 family)